MRIFLSGTSFRPSYGGPARSVSRLALSLASNGIDVGVWAPDQSAEDTEFLGDDSRVRRLWGTLEEAMENFGPADVIHDNGIWLPHNHRIAVLAGTRGIPRLVSTRGMLEPWAMSHKRLKKHLAWWLYQKSDLAGASCHHATASQEGRGLDRFGWKVPVCRIPNGVDMPERPLRTPDAKGLRTALFVGRLYPVKGLPMLIEAWARVRPLGWRVRMVGPDEAGHRAELEAMVRQANLEGVFEFAGSLRGEALERAYAQADLFVLPSHTENFGMVVGEAMARRLPVLTTRGTPWDLLEREGCGWWVPVSVDGIAAALEHATRLSAPELAGMGNLGYHIVSERFGWDKIAQEFIACYEWLLGSGRKPDFVS